MQIRPSHVAVVTGGGDGLGRQLCVELAGRGLDVALCDISAERMEETLEECRQAQVAASTSGRLLAVVCDVSVEAECVSFRDEVMAKLGTQHLNLLVNNAGIAWVGSFVTGPRERWDYNFAVCWGGVYNMCRAFMGMLVASTEGCVANVSSINGLFGSLGPKSEHTSYVAAKFAVRGFTEALINDFRRNAPHLQALVVLPGGIATGIPGNTAAAIRNIEGRSQALSKVQKKVAAAWRSAEDMLSPKDAAKIVLHAVEDGDWRCLVGDDAEAIDAGYRKMPHNLYDLTVPQLAKIGNPEWRSGLKTQLSRRGPSGPPSSRL